MKRSFLLTVNGERHEVFIEPNLTLLELLREDLNLKGAKEACGIGACGACTVLMDGKPVNACIVLALEAEGKEIGNRSNVQSPPWCDSWYDSKPVLE